MLASPDNTDFECSEIPSRFVGAGDGCDCPATGDQSCDPDCAIKNGGAGDCGCDFCYDEKPADDFGKKPTSEEAGGCSAPGSTPSPGAALLLLLAWLGLRSTRKRRAR